MPIKSVSIEHIRNLTSVAFEPSPRINILYGANGSGKTSLLESLHFLGLTRSFRTHQFRYLVSSQQRESLVFSQIDPTASGQAKALGVSRSLEGDVKIRYSGNDIDLSDLASLIPLQVINTDTFELLEGSPATRRQFIDWGSFHYDPAFIQVWRACRRVLQQRNSLLKCGKIDPALRQVWDSEFIHYAKRMTSLRKAYIDQLKPDFDTILEKLGGDLDVTLKFSPGWDLKRELDELLAEQLPRDLKQGFTGIGPQRADLKVKSDGVSAAERLSRGQKKLVVSALKLAQGALFHRMNQRACVYLIDDLPSELDEQHSRLFCEFLEQTNNQCFITCVDPISLQDCWSADTEVAYFQVEDGRLLHTH
ncbi:DNA replication/repair protein RecF [Neptunomonas concharum]|uniref:DNA replication and repair protein RecF n=1 Tax=Neptunomonas concharum TaxID=1031538 RepID=A0A5P1R7G6_9GAMM|nr:DNA replication/repair protein RecF [Neptunomonas concharum]QEQ95215.1 DNA replication/repair protein RecF [Neptunomonas concharum]